MSIDSKNNGSPFINDAKSLAPEAIGIAVGLFTVGFALYLGYLLTSEPIVKLSDYIQILVLLVILSALGVSIYVQRQKEILDESQAYLDSAVDLVNKAYDVLCDEYGKITNDRVSWVTAARLLTRARQLSSKISLTSHQIIYDSEHDYQRHRFGDLLKLNGKDLPLEFFLGTGYILGSVGKSAYKTLNRSGENWLPIRIVSEIYRFKAFPDGYEDPLESSKIFGKKELDKLWLFDHHGVYNYVIFRKYYTFIFQKIYQKKDVKKPVEVSADQIDAKIPTISGFEID